jgi:DNA-binding response OmpR family regulator
MWEHPTCEKWQPVIIVSARGVLEDLIMGFALEAEHYLVKPCTIDDILKAIKLMVKLIPQHKTPSEMDEDKKDGDVKLVE